MLTCAAAPYPQLFLRFPSCSHSLPLSLSSPFCHPPRRNSNRRRFLLRYNEAASQAIQLQATSPDSGHFVPKTLEAAVAIFLPRSISGLLPPPRAAPRLPNPRHPHRLLRLPPPSIPLLLALPNFPSPHLASPILLSLLLRRCSEAYDTDWTEETTDAGSGDGVIVIDNFYTGRKGNAVHHIGNPRKRFCFLNPDYKTNVIRTLNMLGLAKRTGALFLLTSTNEVYGDALEYSQKENYWGNGNSIGSPLFNPSNAAETLAMDFHRGTGVQVRIARIFNAYGPLDQAHWVLQGSLPFYCKVIKCCGDVYSNTTVLRSLIGDRGQSIVMLLAATLWHYRLQRHSTAGRIRDREWSTAHTKLGNVMIAGLIKLMDGENVGPFNLGNPREFTMLDLVEVIKETIDPRATAVFKSKTADDPHKRKPDITKAKQLQNWEPKIPLREGLSIMAKDFRRRIQNE
ncbi:hypothetical protein IEQ34_012686 [Dendrobium chrysotoxum]|uniref:UDP-glucuronate decarboxylase n=1 Tax=Dendrobium chrysotoxum TaxID=161865 RepID=A0AAV7GMJ7_DENCH|nr:hypothetical protein IEQ34_012686 [Dendrobium chrysotoxum]